MTLLTSRLGINFLKWQKEHRVDSISLFMQSVWYLLLQQMHRKESSLLGSIKDTCFPQKHMTWSMRLATTPPSVTTVLLATVLLVAKVKGALRISFRGCIFEVVLSFIDVFELADRLSVVSPAFYDLFSTCELESACSPKANTFLSVPSLLSFIEVCPLVPFVVGFIIPFDFISLFLNLSIKSPLNIASIALNILLPRSFALTSTSLVMESKSTFFSRRMLQQVQRFLQSRSTGLDTV